MDDEQYKLETERRLSALETDMKSVKETAMATNKSTMALEKLVAKYTVVMPILTVLVFVIGILIGPKLGA